MNFLSALVLVGVGVFLLVEVIGFIRDINSRKKAKKELENENEKTETDNN